MPFLRPTKRIRSELARDMGSVGLNVIVYTIVFASLSSAATIFDSGLASIRATDPVQFGRLSRTGTLSDWSVAKPFPGVVNPTVAYHYDTFVLPSVLYPYIQITIDDVSGTAQTFASAYSTSYRPNNTAPNYGLNSNYLGDAGTSGNYFGIDPLTFQVTAPVGGALVLVVNDASATGAGIGQPFRLVVEGFTDTNFGNAPEPATFGLLLAAFGFGSLLAARRKSLRR